MVIKYSTQLHNILRGVITGTTTTTCVRASNNQINTMLRLPLTEHSRILLNFYKNILLFTLVRQLTYDYYFLRKQEIYYDSFKYSMVSS